MLAPDERERIRRSYYVEHKSIQQIAVAEGHCRETIGKAIAVEPRKAYHLKEEHPAPVFQPFQARIDAFLVENDSLMKSKMRWRSFHGTSLGLHTSG
jgi:hypothetical protein